MAISHQQETENEAIQPSSLNVTQTLVPGSQNTMQEDCSGFNSFTEHVKNKQKEKMENHDHRCY